MGHSDTVTGVGDRTRRATTDATIVVDDDLLPLVETFEISDPDGRRTTVEGSTAVEAMPGLLPTKRMRAKTIK